MATIPLQPGTAPANPDLRVAMPTVASIMSAFDPDQLAGFIEVAIGLLDVGDDDPDFEETGIEDGFAPHAADGPGCPIADPGGCQHDGREPDDDDRDAAWIERVDQRKTPLPPMRAELKGGWVDSGQAIGNVEDLEEDDAGEDSDSDRCPAGDDMVASGGLTDQWQPGRWEIGDADDAEFEHQPSSLSITPSRRENLPRPARVGRGPLARVTRS